MRVQYIRLFGASLYGQTQDVNQFALDWRFKPRWLSAHRRRRPGHDDARRPLEPLVLTAHIRATRWYGWIREGGIPARYGHVGEALARPRPRDGVDRLASGRASPPMPRESGWRTPTDRGRTAPRKPSLRAPAVARLGYDPFTPSGRATVSVTITRTARGLKGEIRVDDPSRGGRASRAIESSSGDCAELGKAMALAHQHRRRRDAVVARRATRRRLRARAIARSGTGHGPASRHRRAGRASRPHPPWSPSSWATARSPPTSSQPRTPVGSSEEDLPPLADVAPRADVGRIRSGRDGGGALGAGWAGTVDPSRSRDAPTSRNRRPTEPAQSASGRCSSRWPLA